MSNPTIISVTPAANAVDVVLGSSIIVIFSEPIDTDSVNNSTFVLTGPDYSSLVTPGQLVEVNPTPSQGRGYVLGTFGFSTKTYTAWAPVTAYAVGIQVLDSNGNVQTVSEAGVSSPYAPAWLTTIGATTVDNNIPAWQSLAPYAFSQFILDSNANLQKCTTTGGGSSGVSAPQWNTVLSGTTFDGSVVWTNYGSLKPIVWINGGIANSGGTNVTFTPSRPFAPGIVYTALIVGADSTLASSFVHDLAGNNLLQSYQWSFTTGTLNVVVPPSQNPIAPLKSFINPGQILIVPRPAPGADDPSVSSVSVVELIFPAPINPDSFDPSQLLIGIEPILGDPDVMVPPGATASYIIQGNKLICTISGV